MDQEPTNTLSTVICELVSTACINLCNIIHLESCFVNCHIVNPFNCKRTNSTFSWKLTFLLGQGHFIISIFYHLIKVHFWIKANVPLNILSYDWHEFKLFAQMSLTGWNRCYLGEWSWKIHFSKCEGTFSRLHNWKYMVSLGVFRGLDSGLHTAESECSSSLCKAAQRLHVGATHHIFLYPSLTSRLFIIPDATVATLLRQYWQERGTPGIMHTHTCSSTLYNSWILEIASVDGRWEDKEDVRHTQWSTALP